MHHDNMCKDLLYCNILSIVTLLNKANNQPIIRFSVGDGMKIGNLQLRL